MNTEEQQKGQLLIVAMGPTGIGRSSLCQSIQRVYNDCVIIDLEAIKITMPEDCEARLQYYSAISSALQDHEVVIADAIQIIPSNRIELFEHISLPSYTQVIGIWIDASLDYALKNNEQRGKLRHIQPDDIKNMFKMRVSPSKDEPFDDVIYISQEANIAASRNHPAIKSIVDIISNMRYNYGSKDTKGENDV